MRFLRLWRLPILAVTITGLLYIAGYSYVRSKHYLAHYSGFAYGNTDNHWIAVGDLGLGFNPRRSNRWNQLLGLHPASLG